RSSDLLFGFFCIGALQAHNNGHGNVANGLVGVNYPLGYTVATYNAAKDVDQDGLYFRVFEDDAETGFHRLGIGGTAYVQEVGRLAAAQLDHVHGGHGQAGAVYHTASVRSEERRVGEGRSTSRSA